MSAAAARVGQVVGHGQATDSSTSALMLPGWDSPGPTHRYFVLCRVVFAERFKYEYIW
jgi:hypothetical protein